MRHSDDPASAARTALAGALVAFLGPDGSGKSTVLDAVEARASSSFRRVLRRHWRPHVLFPARGGGADNSNPHGVPPRSGIVSVLKLGFLGADWLLGYVFGFAWRKCSRTLYLFDRHLLDLLVDPARYRYGGSEGLARGLVRLVPAPDFVFVLDAPLPVLRARKTEVSEAEAESQRQRYRALAAELPNAVILDASRPVGEIVDEVVGYLAAVPPSRDGAR